MSVTDLEISTATQAFGKVNLITLVFICYTFMLIPAHAEAPNLQTPSPVIYLADNLDEADNLGWCIDTVGRGFADTLHAHSCKPGGGDVQFRYDRESLQIQSVAFQNKCLTLSETGSTAFALLDCQEADIQQFIYDASTLSFQAQHKPGLCISVAATSQSAGPYMSRALALSNCDETPDEYKQWLILDTEMSN